MGSKLGRRVVYFANLPIKFLMPNSFTNIQEITLKTIPSASKIEIKRALESLYGFKVEKVQTLNMEGKVCVSSNPSQQKVRSSNGDGASNGSGLGSFKRICGASKFEW